MQHPAQSHHKHEGQDSFEQRAARKQKKLYIVAALMLFSMACYLLFLDDWF